MIWIIGKANIVKSMKEHLKGVGSWSFANQFAGNVLIFGVELFIISYR